MSPRVEAPPESQDACFHLSEQGFVTGYKIASYLTDPMYKAHELYRRIGVVDTLNETASKTERTARKSFLMIGAISCGLCGFITTPFGIGLRFVLISLQNRPFIHVQSETPEKILDGNTITLLSWNLCCLLGGRPITERGVMPWSFRIHKLVTNVKDQNADVICLYEISDIQTALHFVEGLKDSYSHFYFNIGPKTLGSSSGMFVASKFEVSNPHFISFPKIALDGQVKYSPKGVFKCEIKMGKTKKSINIFSTYLAPSRIPQAPTQKEIEARKKEMEDIISEISVSMPTVLTGSLNLNDDEYNQSSWKERFEKGEVITDESFTWGGDEFCAKFSDKAHSKPSNLDHTMITKNGTILKTNLVNTAFDSCQFNPLALSNRKGLFTNITFWK